MKTEDEQIDIIGSTLMDAVVTSTGKPFTAGLCIDDYKVDRYLKKLKEKYPKVRVVGEFPGIVPNTKIIHLQGPLA